MALPTKKELETLYYEKKQDSLVWYAWRNALRALPLLGFTSLHKVCEARTIRSSVYSICRVSMVLAQWVESPIHVIYTRNIRETNAFHNACSPVRAAAYVGKAAAAAANSTDGDAEAAVEAAYAATGAYIAANLYSEAGIYAFDAAAADYTLLHHKQDGIDLAFWHSQPLWKGDEPEKIRKLRHNLLNQLKELGLGFLAQDLNTLWEGKPLGVHTKNYLKNLSETITNDPELLRRTILFGEDTEHVHAVRVLLLGPGGAGKSSLADRLQGKIVEQIKRMTIGVEYQQHQPLDLYKTFPDFELEDKKLDLYLWDFGGQTIFHGLHRAFLHENCIYVMVVDSRHEQAPDEWLHQIRHLAGSQAKVLLVTNWYEQCETHQNEVRLLREFPDLLQPGSFFYFSCIDKDQPDFRRFITALVKASLDNQKMVLKETLDVQKAMDEQYKDFIFLRESELQQLIAKKIRRPEEAASTINQLQQLGFLVRMEKGNTRYCLKPAWAVDNAYQLLYSPELRSTNGILNLVALKRVFMGKINEDHVEYLVSFLKERYLCRQLQMGDGGYFFPDATRANEPPEVAKLLAQDSKLILRFDLPYLPLGFHARLVHHLFAPQNDVGIITPDDIWRQGFILQARSSKAVVQYLLRKDVIEMTLIGNLQDFSDLLSEFYTHLKAVLVSSANGIKVEQIHTSVLHNQQLFSVHSSEGLISILEHIKSYKELFNEVRKMAGKINVNVGNGSQVAIDAHNVMQKNRSDNTITVTADQRKIISSVLDEMLRHKTNLADDALEAVYDVRKVVKADETKPTEKTQSLLGKVWAGLNDVTEFTRNITDISGFVIEHQAEIIVAIKAAVGILR